MGGGTEAGRGNHLMAHLERLEALRRGRAFPPPPPPAKRGRRRGSFNHEFLLRVGQYADGKLAENGPQDARSSLIEWLDGQTREGHCVRGKAIETLSASHGQLNAAAAAVGLLFAEEREDGRLTELFRDWWWSEVTLCEACEVPGAGDAKWTKDLITVWAPGWRALKKGALVAWNSGRDNAYRLIKGYDVPTRKERPALYSTSRYDLAFRALSMLPAESLRALRPAPGWVPPLPFQFHARRSLRPDSFFAWFDAPEHPDLCLSVGAPVSAERWLQTDNMIAQASFPVELYQHIDYPVKRSAK